MKLSVAVLGVGGFLIGLYGFYIFDSSRFVTHQNLGINLMILGAILVVGAFILEAIAKQHDRKRSERSMPPSAKERGRYRVYGTDRDSGMDTELVVAADNSTEARGIGIGKGIVVSRVDLVERITE